MPVSQKMMKVLVCDNCGVEFICDAEESAVGLFISVLHVQEDKTVTAEVYACTSKCVGDGLRAALDRSTMDPSDLEKDLKALRRKGILAEASTR